MVYAISACSMQGKACLVLANMAYVNQFAALRLLEAGADKAACELIQNSDKTKHSDVMEAASKVQKKRLPVIWFFSVDVVQYGFLGLMARLAMTG